jgi:hypothetical protein
VAVISESLRSALDSQFVDWRRGSLVCAVNLRSENSPLRDDDLIGQEWMTVGQIQNGLMRQLLGVIGARSALEDDRVIRINDMEIADPTVCDPIDVPFDELGNFLMILAQFGTVKT